jgi:hypothetical protein
MFVQNIRTKRSGNKIKIEGNQEPNNLWKNNQVRVGWTQFSKKIIGTLGVLKL